MIEVGNGFLTSPFFRLASPRFLGRLRIFEEAARALEMPTLVAVTQEYETVLVVFDEHAKLRVKKT